MQRRLRRLIEDSESLGRTPTLDRAIGQQFVLFGKTLMGDIEPSGLHMIANGETNEITATSEVPEVPETC